MSSGSITIWKFYNLLIFYSHLDSSNRPSTQKSLEKMKQTASQMWCLLRMLPFLIGHLVPYDSPEWKLYLLLRTIMDLVFAPTISFDATFALEAMIAEHHSVYLEVCRSNYIRFIFFSCHLQWCDFPVS